MLHGFFFGFTRNLSIFKVKTRKRKLFCRQIQADGFFLFQAVIGFFSSNHGALYKNKSTCPKRPAAIRTPGMPCLVECLKFATVAICCENVPYRGKNFPCISQSMKKA